MYKLTYNLLKVNLKYTLYSLLVNSLKLNLIHNTKYLIKHSENRRLSIKNKKSQFQICFSPFSPTLFYFSNL